MRSALLLALLPTTPAFSPPHSSTSTKWTNISLRATSGDESRSLRPSFAPLSHDAGHVGSTGPIGIPVRPHQPPRLASSPTLTSSSSSKTLAELERLQRALKERNDDVDSLVYEVHRLQEWHEAVREINDARARDFAILKQEAEQWKKELDKKKIDLTNGNNNHGNEQHQWIHRLERELKKKEALIQRLQFQLHGGTNRISHLETGVRHNSDSSSHSLVHHTAPSNKFRETKSVSNENDVLLGGAPIVRRAPKQNEKVTRDESSNNPVLNRIDLSSSSPARQSLPDNLYLEVIPGKGLGVRTNAPITKGTLLGEYKGEIIDRQTKDRRYLQSMSHLQTPQDLKWRQSRLDRGQTLTGTYLYGVTVPNGEPIYVDGEDEYCSTWTRFINHASMAGANVDPKSIHESWNGEPRVWFVTNRDIETGEEICFDYGDDYWLPEDNIVM